MIGNVDSKLDTEWQLKVNIICNLSVSGAAEQVNSWGGGQGDHAKLTPLHAPPGKFSNLHALRLNLEPSGGI